MDTMNESRTFTEEEIWDAIERANEEVMNDDECYGLLKLASEILGVDFEVINIRLDKATPRTRAERQTK